MYVIMNYIIYGKSCRYIVEQKSGHQSHNFDLIFFCSLFLAYIPSLTFIIAWHLGSLNQERLTEGEGLVHLTSPLGLLVL